jgi:small ligand-binding sensory domain FIST
MPAALSTLPFITAHATHPDWRGATELALVQLEAQASSQGRKSAGNTGFLYISDLLSEHASDILTTIKVRTGISTWVGCTGMGVFANTAEYHDEPAVCMMVGWFDEGSVQVFSGRDALPQTPARLIRYDDDEDIRGQVSKHADGALHGERCLVHAAPQTPMLNDVVAELAGRMNIGHVFGGLSSSRQLNAQFADVTFAGGLSGLVFASHLDVRTRITQGCYPLHPLQRGWRVLEHEGAWVTAVSHSARGRSAFRALLQDLSLVDEEGTIHDVDPQALKAKLQGGVFVSVTPPSAEAGGALAAPSDNTVVMRGLAGIDPLRGSIAVGGNIAPGSTLRFCKRDAQAAKMDLMRVCTELREEFEEAGITPRGAIVISCLSRGQALFGSSGAELAIIQRGLGYTSDKPLPCVGFAASGEIANGDVHGYTAVVAVFA